jgi:hypothetical protein
VNCFIDTFGATFRETFRKFKKFRQNKRDKMTEIPSFVIFSRFFTVCHPKHQLEKYTPPYGTALGDPILMEETVFNLTSIKIQARSCKSSLFNYLLLVCKMHAIYLVSPFFHFIVVV